MQAFGQKNGPLGPTRAAGLSGPVRVVICSRSPSWFLLRGRTCSHDCVHPRREADYSRGIPAHRALSAVAGFRPAVGASARGLARALGGARPRTSSPSRSSTRVAARRSSASTSSSASSQRLCQASRLASILRRALGGQARDHHPPVGLRARALDVAALGEVVEHLRDRRRREPRRGRELAGRQLAALVQLDQQLELGVAELGAAEVRVAPAQAAEAAEHAAEGLAELGQLAPASRSAPRRPLRAGRLVPVAGSSRRSLNARAARRPTSALGRRPRRSAPAARGFSARSSTTQGISDSTAIPSDHQ